LRFSTSSAKQRGRNSYEYENNFYNFGVFILGIFRVSVGIVWRRRADAFFAAQIFDLAVSAPAREAKDAE
jgi:hypothetical protein